jgi:SAM-dependent methyltransferase
MMHPNEVNRRRLACELVGEGIEIGPGCHPLPLAFGTRAVTYIDRFNRDSFLATFPECQAEIEGFPSAIVPMDVTKERLVHRFGPRSQDFVILNHVLEHIVDPLALLADVHEVLRDGGILYVAIPDKRYMFDRHRPRTRLAELIDRHCQHLSEPTDEMIVNFIEQAEQLSRRLDLTRPEDARRVADHRRRSIHVNVWVVEDLLQLLGHLSHEMETPWLLMDGLVTPTETILLARSSSDPRDWLTTDRVMNRIWFDSHAAWIEREVMPGLEAINRTGLDAHDRLLLLDERVRETQNFVRRIKQMLERLPLVKRLVGSK